jgi:hypothetical protein
MSTLSVFCLTPGETFELFAAWSQAKEGGAGIDLMNLSSANKARARSISSNLLRGSRHKGFQTECLTLAAKISNISRIRPEVSAGDSLLQLCICCQS